MQSGHYYAKKAGTRSMALGCRSTTTTSNLVAEYSFWIRSKAHSAACVERSFHVNISSVSISSGVSISPGGCADRQLGFRSHRGSLKRFLEVEQPRFHQPLFTTTSTSSFRRLSASSAICFFVRFFGFVGFLAFIVDVATTGLFSAALARLGGGLGDAIAAGAVGRLVEQASVLSSGDALSVEAATGATMAASDSAIPAVAASLEASVIPTSSASNSKRRSLSHRYSSSEKEAYEPDDEDVADDEEKRDMGDEEERAA
ncbi:hypothetical protein PC116_g2896 [Phytophthora cactorum]|nr:hypothetical protein PC116_g2896 [Phytophthora cactorum]